MSMYARGAAEAPRRHARRSCPYCVGEFRIKDIDTGGVVRRIISCPTCGSRWRERDYLCLSVPMIHRAIEEVDAEVRLTTRSWVEFPITDNSQC